MTSNDNNAALHTLGDRGHTVDGSANDVRGREVKDQDGEGLGNVSDLLVDDHENKVRFLLVEHGGFLGIGRTKTLIPVDDITEITRLEVRIDHSLGHVADGPGYDPGLESEPVYLGTVYDHYGRAPYWGVGYGYLTPSRRQRPARD